LSQWFSTSEGGWGVSWPQTTTATAGQNSHSPARRTGRQGNAEGQPQRGGLNAQFAADFSRQAAHHAKAQAAALLRIKAIRQSNAVIADGQRQLSVPAQAAIHRHDQRHGGGMGIFHRIDERFAQDQHDRLHMAHLHHAVGAGMHHLHLLVGRGQGGDQRGGDFFEMRLQADHALGAAARQDAVELADRIDARGDAVQHQPDIGGAEHLLLLLYRDRLHPDHADQEGQAVGDAVIGFRDQIGGGGGGGLGCLIGEGSVHEETLLSPTSMHPSGPGGNKNIVIFQLLKLATGCFGTKDDLAARN
jgi:hypothetical protein